MTAPTTPIDADLVETSNDQYYVLEIDALWYTSNLTTAGAATWAKVLDAAVVGPAFGLSGLRFHRVRAVGGYVQVLASATGDAGSDVYLFRSSNAGAVWGYNQVTTGIASAEYTVDIATGTLTVPATEYELQHQDLAADYTPMALVMTHGTAADLWAGWDSKASAINQFDSSNTDTGGVNYAALNSSLSVGDEGTVSGWLDDYFGAGGWQKFVLSWRQSFQDAAGADTVSLYAIHATNGTSVPFTSYVFWNKPQELELLGFDVAPTNPSFVYVGLRTKILSTTDGGSTWTEIDDTVGANDLAVHPSIAGLVTAWDTAGNLVQYITGIKQAALMTETATEVFGRIAYDANGFLFVIQSGTTLKARRNAIWVELLTGIVGGRSLRAYTGGRIAFLDDSSIQWSEDDGANFADKTGDWASWSAPISFHLGRDL